MVQIRTVRVVTYDERLYDGNGLVNRWAQGITRELKRNVRAFAPVNKRARPSHGGAPGNLKSKIRSSTMRTGPKRLASVVESTAPYSMYVIGGTAAQGRRYIYSRAGWANKAQVDRVARRVHSGLAAWDDPDEARGMYMRVPRRHGGDRVFLLRVHGQKANNFMAKGFNATAANHSSLTPLRSDQRLRRL